MAWLLNNQTQRQTFWGPLMAGAIITSRARGDLLPGHPEEHRGRPHRRRRQGLTPSRDRSLPGRADRRIDVAAGWRCRTGGGRMPVCWWRSWPGTDGAGRLQPLHDDGTPAGPAERGRRPGRRGRASGRRRRAALAVAVDGRALPAAAARRRAGGPLPRSGADRGAAARARRALGRAAVAGRALGPAARPAGAGGPAAPRTRAARATARRRSSTSCPRRRPASDPLDARSSAGYADQLRPHRRDWAARTVPAAGGGGVGRRAGRGRDGARRAAVARRRARRGAARAARRAAGPLGGPPRRLVELTGQISEAFGGLRLHPESPAEVLRAFARAGIVLPSTRAWVLREVDHPAVPLLLEFKELYRIWTAHGWSWRAQWVRDGRFHPEYVPGGVVSGRWATRGGGALQIPKVVRRAVVADDGLDVSSCADAGQLEPRVLAAVAGDARLAAAGRRGRPLRGAGRRRVRRRPGQGEAGPARRDVRADRRRRAARRWPRCRRRFPTAWEYVERAARTGEGGGLVRSWLGRTCPPAPDEPMIAGAGPGPRPVHPQLRHPGHRRRVGAGAAGGAADRGCAGTGAELVFFQHDEVVVHAPAGARRRGGRGGAGGRGAGRPVAVRRDAGPVPAAGQCGALLRRRRLSAVRVRYGRR